MRAQYQGWEICEGYGDAQRWCKAAAVQDGLTRATGDLLVIADADVWSDHLQEAVDAVASGAAWASPHRKVRRLTEAGTTRFLNGERDDLEVEQHHNAHLGGGIVVLSRSLYEDIPLDPRFVGWGQEDDSWACALTTLAGKPWQGDESLWHLWHPPQHRQSRVVGNAESKALGRRYKSARRSPALMRALLDEVADGKAVSA